ncbi:uncharacterized protein LOC144819612 [Lissotriton helveticus]
MVDEILLVEPHIFGAQVQYTTHTRKAEMWERIVNRVNAVGATLRTQGVIRKQWIKLRQKVCGKYILHYLEAQRTGGGPPSPPLQLMPWEEKVLAILHTEGLSRIPGGQNSGESTTASEQRQEGCQSHSPNQERDETLINANAPEPVDVYDCPGPSRQPRQTPTFGLTGLTPPTTAETPQIIARPTTSAPSTASNIHCPPALASQIAATTTTGVIEEQGPSGRVQSMPRAQGSGATCCGRVIVGPQREPTDGTDTQAAITQVLEVYQDCLSVLDQAVTEMGEMKVLHEGIYQEVAKIQVEVGRIYPEVAGLHTEVAGVRTEVACLHSEVTSLVGVLREMNSTLCRAFPLPSTPPCEPSTSTASTSAAATGGEALPEEDTSASAPGPAAQDPPSVRKRGRPSKNSGSKEGKKDTTTSKRGRT